MADGFGHAENVAASSSSSSSSRQEGMMH